METIRATAENKIIFEWSTLTVGEWETLLKKSPSSNWMQTWPYAKASHQRDFRSTRTAILNYKGSSVGFVALQEIKLGPVHYVHLNRGPMWFSENPKIEWLESFAKEFSLLFPKRPLRKRSLVIEWPDSEYAQKVFENHGFKKEQQTYETVWIDITKSTDEIRAGLKQKWRNSLNKSLKSEIQLQSDWTGKHFNYFLQNYEKHKHFKNYQGPSSAFLNIESDTAAQVGNTFCLWANKDSKPIAGIMIMLHGSTASYRIGWNTPEGRECNAHYGLLWTAIEMLKKKNLQAFDLGGIIRGEAEGLTRFKTGMGGKEVKLLGFFS